MAPKDETTTSTVEPSNLLSQIASDFDEDENTSGAVTEKLAEIVNKRFSAPLGEEKLKEKLGQYLRPDNCAKLAVPKVNPEIWMKLNRPASRQDLHMASIQRAIVKAGTALTQLAEILLTTPSGTTGPDLGKLLTMNADAVALLGHATHQLSMHRRQAIKPFLNKEYATLCSPQGPVTEFLFGDELQSQLNNIKASNKIGNTMASESPRPPAKGKEPWKNKPKEYLKNKVSNFQAGRLSSYAEQWKLLTSDKFILDMVTGAHIELSSTPFQVKCQQKKLFSSKERLVIDSEIKSLLAKGVIVPSVTEPGEYISPIFIIPKKDGSYRMILNLKQFNEHVAYHHFKMDTLASAISMMKPLCFMASVDFKDAYYSVPIASTDQKYLKFIWDGQLYKFVCFPNGLACCPRMFTKLLKPVYANLRQQGYESSGYIDDSYLQGDDFADCVANVKVTVHMFDSLGLITHPEKSVLIPTQRLTYLGFILDSKEMKIYLTPEKTDRLIKLCVDILKKPKSTVQEIASLVGMMTASFPAVMYGPLHYRSIDMDKNEALKKSKGNFNSSMTLSSSSIEDLHWWSVSLPSAFNVVQHS
ncbi:Hypothetical predicted protein, partial [Paramuricea clavata]